MGLARVPATLYERQFLNSFGRRRLSPFQNESDVSGGALFLRVTLIAAVIPQVRADAIGHKAVGEWFEEDDAVPFMMQVFQIREEKRAQIPAVTHVDGSGRLQTVHRHTNPRFHRLIESFRDITGIPMVLNTSFNENEPVVCRPEEALDCFLRSNMDELYLGDILIARQ